MADLGYKFKKAIFSLGAKILGLSQEENDAMGGEAFAGISELAKNAAAEGAVLLKNDGVLPFKSGEKIAIFGRCQADWFYVGYGSGGDVRPPYRVNLIDGLRNCGTVEPDPQLLRTYAKWREENPVDHGFWANWPRYYPEMPLSDELVSEARGRCDAAVVVIGRAAGEDRENALEKGSFYLTDDEIDMLDKVSSVFDRTVVLLNVGNVIDFSWIDGFGGRIGAALLVWQGGMESGNAVAEILCGKVNPSGKLTSAIARDYASYPSSDCFGGKKYNEYREDIYVGYRWFETFAKDAVQYPFGFGLGYSKFNLEVESAVSEKADVIIKVKVSNVGTYSGKEVVQVYVEAPQGRLGKPSRSLAAFAKTGEIAAGEAQSVTLRFTLDSLASYDDSGRSGHRSCYVLEEGVYKIYLGTDVRSATDIFEFELPKTSVVKRLSEVSAPKAPLDIVIPAVTDGGLIPKKIKSSRTSTDLKRIILDNLPPAIPMTGDLGYKLSDVREGKVSLRDFVAQLSLDELEAISRGDYVMNSSLGAAGNAGVFGGVLQSLRDKGVPAMTTTDGPSGIRLKASASLLPMGTLLACTWNTALVESLYSKVADEMAAKGSDVLLAPGMNIHRNPLCGRNFEYFSEDPLLSGKIAAAAVRGIQSRGGSACPKHFACNNQETRRNRNDSRLSERALREIYLKGFEICVGESQPKNIMTSYNKINGVWCHYNYELCTTILRKEWGYKGNVMTDWWMQHSKSREFPALRDNAYRVRAQVDVLMPGGWRVGRRKPDGTLLKTLNRRDGITLGELQRVAENVLNYILCTEKV